MLRVLGITAADVLLVGDGSGSVRGSPAGWACIAYDRRTAQVLLHTGGFRRGTSNLAELMAFVPPLAELLSDEQKTLIRIVLVTDSKYVCHLVGTEARPKKNVFFWSLLRSARTAGAAIRAVHLDRNTHPWHAACDAASKTARKKFVIAKPGAKT